MLKTWRWHQWHWCHWCQSIVMLLMAHCIDWSQIKDGPITQCCLLACRGKWVDHFGVKWHPFLHYVKGCRPFELFVNNCHKLGNCLKVIAIWREVYPDVLRSIFSCARANGAAMCKLINDALCCSSKRLNALCYSSKRTVTHRILSCVNFSTSLVHPPPWFVLFHCGNHLMLAVTVLMFLCVIQR